MPRLRKKNGNRTVDINAEKPSRKRLSNISTGNMLKTDWTEYNTGPYKSIPNTQELVIEGYLMNRYDPTVGSIITVIRELICTKLGKYHNEDENIEAFVDETLNNLDDGLRDTISAMLSCLWAGFSVCEKVWETDSNSWRIKSINLLHPLTFFDRFDGKKGIVYDKELGKVTEVKQLRWNMNDDIVTHDIDNVVYWAFQKELREDVYGRRLTDRARRSWYMKSKIELYWSIFLERFAHPTPIFMIPRGTISDEHGRTITNSEYYADAIGDLAPGNGIAIEVAPEDKYDFKLMESSSSGEGYEKSLSYHNAEIFKSMLMSPLLLTEPENGSRAQASTAMDFFILLVDAIRSELGAIIIDQIVKPMLKYNYGENADLGEWEFEEIVNDDLVMLADVLQKIAASNAVVFCKEDEASIRDKFKEVGLVDMQDIAPESRVAAETKKESNPLGIVY